MEFLFKANHLFFFSPHIVLGLKPKLKAIHSNFKLFMATTSYIQIGDESDNNNK